MISVLTLDRRILEPVCFYLSSYLVFLSVAQTYDQRIIPTLGNLVHITSKVPFQLVPP